MRRKKDKQDFVDLIIHEEIMKEGERLEKELGPVTFQESPDFDIEKSYLELEKKIEARDREETVGLGMVPEGTAIRKKHGRTSGKFRVAKMVLVCFAVVVCVFAFSMTSEATRVWWTERLERVIGGESGTIVNNDENRVETELPEWEAAAEIQAETEIPVPKFMVRPAEMQFDSYTYDDALKFAYMYYVMGEQVVILYMQGADSDSTSGIHYGGEVLNEEEVITEYGTVLIEEIQSDGDESSSQVAEWNYDNYYYRIVGKMDEEVMISMIESMYY